MTPQRGGVLTYEGSNAFRKTVSALLMCTPIVFGEMAIRDAASA